MDLPNFTEEGDPGEFYNWINQRKNIFSCKGVRAED